MYMGKRNGNSHAEKHCRFAAFSTLPVGGTVTKPSRYVQIMVAMAED